MISKARIRKLEKTVETVASYEPWAHFAADLAEMCEDADDYELNSFLDAFQDRFTVKDRKLLMEIVRSDPVTIARDLWLLFYPDAARRDPPI